MYVYLCFTLSYSCTLCIVVLTALRAVPSSRSHGDMYMYNAHVHVYMYMYM